MDVPHNEKRFAGYDKDSKELDAETMQKYIMVRPLLPGSLWVSFMHSVVRIGSSVWHTFQQRVGGMLPLRMDSPL
jgi:hypothetical protein